MARHKQRMKSIRAPGPVLPGDAEKQAIIAQCEAFIRDVLMPRFLPEITPKEWN